MCAMGVAYITPPLATRGSVCPLITYLAPPEISAIDIGTTVTTKNTAWMDQTRDRSALPGRLISYTIVSLREVSSNEILGGAMNVKK